MKKAHISRALRSYYFYSCFTISSYILYNGVIKIIIIVSLYDLSFDLKGGHHTYLCIMFNYPLLSYNILLAHTHPLLLFFRILQKGYFIRQL